jgi:hypothetical protein
MTTGNGSNGNGMTTLATRVSDSAYGQAGQAIERRGFGSMELEERRETQGIAAAETAKALVQARYIVAMQRPRDVDDFRARLMKHCRRLRFASTAEYAKPIGGSHIKGISVRFVEAALQEYRNVQITATPTYDDEEKRIVKVTVTDLEGNITHELDVTAEKFVERKQATGDVIRERRKKNGESVYLVRATEDDYANKIGAAVSKAIRNLGLRILPSDIVAECMELCLATVATEDKRDPDAARKAIGDSFASIGVMPSALKEYLGHDLGTCSPEEIKDLRAVFVAIRDGESTWQATIDGKRAEAEKPADKTGDALKAKMAAAPLKDKAGEAKPATPKPRSTAAIEVRRKALASSATWSRNGDRHLGAVEDIEIAIEQTGPEMWSWWVTKAGEDVGSGDAGDLELAKGQAVAEAAKS